MTRALGILAGLLLLTPIAGFLLFLAEVQASARSKPQKADVIVALSGDPRRGVVAVGLLKDGFSRRLIIVGQDNQHEVELLRAANPALFSCCVRVDHSSLNTVEDAQLVRKLVPKGTTNSVLLVTSAFHLPRARSELRKALPEAQIIGHGVPDEFYRPGTMFSDSEVASAFVRQYLMYVGSWISEDYKERDRSGAKQVLHFVSDVTNLAVIAILVLTSLFVMFAASKHRRRHATHSHRGASSGTRAAK